MADEAWYQDEHDPNWWRIKGTDISVRYWGDGPLSGASWWLLRSGQADMWFASKHQAIAAAEALLSQLTANDHGGTSHG